MNTNDVRVIYRDMEEDDRYDRVYYSTYYTKINSGFIATIKRYARIIMFCPEPQK